MWFIRWISLPPFLHLLLFPFPSSLLSSLHSKKCWSRIPDSHVIGPFAQRRFIRYHKNTQEENLIVLIWSRCIHWIQLFLVKQYNLLDHLPMQLLGPYICNATGRGWVSWEGSFIMNGTNNPRMSYHRMVSISQNFTFWRKPNFLAWFFNGLKTRNPF